MSAPDAGLVARDRRLRGLAVVLDTDALSAVVREAFPADAVSDVRPSYVRYKPGVSCMVRADVHGPDGAWSLHATAYSDDAPHHSRALSRRPVKRFSRGPVRIRDQAVVLRPFPFDDKLRALERLSDPEARLRLLKRTWPSVPDTGTTLRTLAYKPERRWAAALEVDGAPVATFKFHVGAAHDNARRGAEAFRSRGRLRVATPLGHSTRYGVIAQEWLPGEHLLDCHQKTVPNNARWVGEALATLHAHCYRQLATTPPDRMPAALAGLALDVAFVWPAINRRATALADQLARRLIDGRSELRPTHGDFYAKQVLVSGDQIAFLDLDDAAMDEAEIDLGNFIAHLELEALRGRLTRSQVAEASEAFVGGYASVTGWVDSRRIRIHTAAALFRLLPRPFRSRLPDWPEQTEAILNRAESLASEDAGTRRSLGTARARNRFDRVNDPFGALADPALPMLEAAVNPDSAERAFAEALDMRVGVRSTRITRHKAGRRCLIEYDVETRGGAFTWIGKMRARGCDERTARVQAALEQSGFDGESETGVSVPHVIGCVTPLHLWLQEKVLGRSAAELLARADGDGVAADAVRAVRRLHTSQVVPSRSHQLADELRVLDDRLTEVGNLFPAWRRRLTELMAGCRSLAGRLAPQPVRYLHRDFYADQVMVNHGRVFLLDLDTYAAGDEALDAGNFLAHVIESRLRAPDGGGPSPDVDAAIVDGYLGGRSCEAGLLEALDFYTTVALARLVHVSTRMPERRPFTSRILDAVEARLCGVYTIGQTTPAPT